MDRQKLGRRYIEIFQAPRDIYYGAIGRMLDTDSGVKTGMATGRGFDLTTSPLSQKCSHARDASSERRILHDATTSGGLEPRRTGASRPRG